jgi:histone H3/H4
MENEVRKTAALRRGVRDALASADFLAREASRYAAADNRKTLQLEDVRKAYQANFCQVWPFCR